MKQLIGEAWVPPCSSWGRAGKLLSDPVLPFQFTPVLQTQKGSNSLGFRFILIHSLSASPFPLSLFPLSPLSPPSSLCLSPLSPLTLNTQSSWEETHPRCEASRHKEVAARCQCEALVVCSMGR